LALALSEQHWTQIGQGNDPLTMATDDFETNVQRVTALLLVRVVARVMEVYKQTREEEIFKDQESESEFMSMNTKQRSSTYKLPFPDTNWSTTHICAVYLEEKHAWPLDAKVVQQVEWLVRNILKQYDPKVPYHNASHGTHVTLSTNKLLDMLWVHRCNSFGLRQNAMSLLALVFSALTHDVEHQGLPNRQLAVEDDELAVLYNDNSIAEQRSLYIGFKELLKPDYQELRAAVFPTKQDYRDFRQKVVDLILTTDIASPERTQLAKSKYVEAFGAAIAAAQKAAGDDAIEPTEDEVEDTMIDHVRNMPMNTVKILNKGMHGVTEGVMNVADASVSGVKNVAVFGVTGVKKIGEASMDGVKNVTKGMKEMVSGVRPTDGSDKSPKSSKPSVLGNRDAAGQPEGAMDIMQQAKKFTVVPVQNTVKLVTGSFGSLGTSLGLNKSKKLGIRVSMDLTGETVETYSRKPRRNSYITNEEVDVVDELKAAVLMDLMSKLLATWWRQLEGVGM
jgi:hypothetical protein